MKRHHILTILLHFFLSGTTLLHADPVQAILQQARTHIGAPYQYGAAGPRSFDCSGFIVYLFRDKVPGLPRTSRAMGSFGRPVIPEALQAGDIILYATTGNPGLISHVALYMGNDSIIHAISNGPNSGVGITSFHANYWKTRYHSARRILPDTELEKAAASPPVAQQQPMTFAKGVYLGTLKGGEPHGHGRFRFNNGDSYEGEFLNGRFDGSGVYIWQDGTRHSGNFRNGRATRSLPDNRVFYVQIEDSPWEDWNGPVWGDYKEWREQERSDFEAFLERERQETEKRR